MGKPKAKKLNNLLKEAQLEKRQREHSKHGGLVPESVLFTTTLLLFKGFPDTKLCCH